jgi:hypothetical protein
LQNDFLLGPVVSEDVEWIFNPLPVALSKGQMELVFWALLLEIVLGYYDVSKG